MADSPLALAREALAYARAALPAYGSARSRGDYTLPQHVAALAVKQFSRTDSRGLAKVPHSTTLRKAAARLKKDFDAVLTATLGPPAPVRAAVDAAGSGARPGRRRS